MYTHTQMHTHNFMYIYTHTGLPWWLTVKRLLTMQETQVLFLGQEDTLEKGMATHYSILAWRIPWTEAGCIVHRVTKSWT